ncbi:MAG: hypothetical protein EBZ48_14575 [Proteobacteria bacterium]|nr:hypothetical protein [Pseudomonadota bacterium]
MTGRAEHSDPQLVQIHSRHGVDTTAARPGVFIKTYGCQMNEYDSAKLLKLVEQRYNPVDSAEKAELILINTCSVRDKPEQKLYSLLGRVDRIVPLLNELQ